MDELLGTLVIRRPAAVAVLTRLGIDLTLEHGRTLEDAAAMRDLRSDDVLARIADAEHRAPRAPTDWATLQVRRPFLSTWQPGQYLLATSDGPEPEATAYLPVEEPAPRPSVVAVWP